MSAAWIKALGFAALPGSETVIFARKSGVTDGIPTTSYTLRCFDAAGQEIGDDRDYDLLKAAITPLERLADREDHANLTMELSISEGQLRQIDSA